MNWTGGRLQQSRRAGNTISAKQKAYFAKARTRLRAGQPTHSPLCFSGLTDVRHQNDELIGGRDEDGQRRLEEFENVAPLAKRLEGMRERETKREKIEIGALESKKRRRDELDTFEKASPPTHARDESDLSLDDDGELESRRKRLLHRADWLGTEPTKPLKMKFPSRRDRERIGRRRALKNHELSNHNRIQDRTPHKRHHRDMPRSGPEISRQDEISIRIGNGIHSSQKTLLPPSVSVQLGYPTDSGVIWSGSDEMLDPNLSSGSMLLDTSKSCLDNGEQYREVLSAEAYRDLDEMRLSAEPSISGEAKIETAVEFTKDPYQQSGDLSACSNSVHTTVYKSQRPDLNELHLPSRDIQHMELPDPKAKDENERRRRLVNVPVLNGSRSSQVLSTVSNQKISEGYILISSDSDESSSDNDCESVMSKENIGTRLESQGVRRLETTDKRSARHSPTQQLINELRRAAGLKEPKEKPNPREDTTLPKAHLPITSRRDPVSMEQQDNVSSGATAEEENELWFKFVFANELTQYLIRPDSPEPLNAQDAESLLISAAHSSDDMASMRVEPSNSSLEKN
ncbi:MAG: hypothetical protein MMC23_005256 [Stictis urceolatum]|nr:hypothetical protein [Stictis urceolata]